MTKAEALLLDLQELVSHLLALAIGLLTIPFRDIENVEILRDPSLGIEVELSEE